ncbi:hypothetical protein [Giesbergeria anulus]|uniref:Uncharacterized protein n=1 Tax=Giesbergeria anulus TaxID=180197 RepID=A0A1H9R651_9BURK|nr:hypothetical protein [Giesbergeria anulus]SER68005.1 hypothetical protein SAMN02982919_02807 [Giesbergeria anulus]
MQLHKTEKAHQELSSGMRTLGLRERSLLLLAGSKPTSTLQAMYDGMGAQILESLLHLGYLTDNTTHVPMRTELSLAGARMYLFDVCERMFARRHPDLAHHLRTTLRNARDGDTLRHVAEELFSQITHHAGDECAASLRAQMPAALTSPALNEKTG